MVLGGLFICIEGNTGDIKRVKVGRKIVNQQLNLFVNYGERMEENYVAEWPEIQRSRSFLSPSIHPSISHFYLSNEDRFRKQKKSRSAKREPLSY